ncbi:hypothetical protein BDFB_014597, partial [Asbolus verrucosus]
FEEKTREAIGASTRVFTEPRTRNTIPQWIVELIKAKNRARRRAHRTGDPADRREANRLTNEVRYSLSDFRNQQWENKLESLTTEDNSLWKMAKALRNDRKPLPPIHGTAGLVYTDEEKAEAFADSLELQCRTNEANADLDHVDEIEQFARNV